MGAFCGAGFRILESMDPHASARKPSSKCLAAHRSRVSQPDLGNGWVGPPVFFPYKPHLQGFGYVVKDQAL